MLRSRILGSRTVFRLKARSCLVKSDARSPALLIALRGPADWGVRGQFHEPNVGIAHHDAHEVVEVVGDTAGEQAECLHLLRLAELGFEVSVLCYVHRRAYHAEYFSGGVADREGAVMNPAYGAVRAQDTVGFIILPTSLFAYCRLPDMFHDRRDEWSPTRFRAKYKDSRTLGPKSFQMQG